MISRITIRRHRHSPGDLVTITGERLVVLHAERDWITVRPATWRERAGAFARRAWGEIVWAWWAVFS